MTDNEIKKALECCIKSSHFGECFENKCPMVSEKGCKVGKEGLYPYALDLINRQKAEIAVLKSDLVMKTNDYENTKGLYENAIKISQKMHDKLVEAYKKLQNAKSEAIKEFAERLKEEYSDFGELHEEIRHDNLIYAIDNLVKEMTEKDDD